MPIRFGGVFRFSGELPQKARSLSNPVFFGNRGPRGCSSGITVRNPACQMIGQPVPCGIVTQSRFFHFNECSRRGSAIAGFGKFL